MTILIPAWLDGKLTPVEKLEAHEKGLRHKAISVFVMDGDRVLLQQRALGKYHTPGLWTNTCCTHPDWGEDPADCAQRRLDEELGITGLTLEHRKQIEYRADVGHGLIEHEVVEIYLAYAPAGLKVRPNPAEVMETRWVDFEKLCEDVERFPDVYTPWLRIYLRDHKATLFGHLATAG